MFLTITRDIKCRSTEMHNQDGPRLKTATPPHPCTIRPQHRGPHRNLPPQAPTQPTSSIALTNTPIISVLVSTIFVFHHPPPPHHQEAPSASARAPQVSDLIVMKPGKESKHESIAFFFAPKEAPPVYRSGPCIMMNPDMLPYRKSQWTNAQSIPSPPRYPKRPSPYRQRHPDSPCGP